jgi:hypothetical protein
MKLTYYSIDVAGIPPLSLSHFDSYRFDILCLLTASSFQLAESVGSGHGSDLCLEYVELTLYDYYTPHFTVTHEPDRVRCGSRWRTGPERASLGR